MTPWFHPTSGEIRSSEFTAGRVGNRRGGVIRENIVVLACPHLARIGQILFGWTFWKGQEHNEPDCATTAFMTLLIRLQIARMLNTQEHSDGCVRRKPAGINKRGTL